METMSSKRRATSDLNHDNWDREMEPEKKGIFTSATEEELKNRVIRKARRKLTGTNAITPADDSDGPTTKSVFSGFAGFGKTPSTASTATAFSSISTTTSETETNSEGTKPAASVFSFLSKFTTPTTDTKTDTQTLATNNNNYSFGKSNTYYAKLKGLNQTVSSWIKTHVDKNPLCLLTPIFKDYEKYLAEIEKNEGTENKPEAVNNQPQALSSFKFSATSPPSTTFSFGNNKTDTTDSAPAPAQASAPAPAKSIFGNLSSQASEDKSKTVTPTNTTGFSFGFQTNSTTSGATSLTASNSTGFSFSGAKPFSFGNVAPPPASAPSTETENGDDEDEPPKVEFKAVVEEDSVYSHRCKIFVKNDGTFTDRGVGTLYLKPVKDSEKTQLLVRADTNLGNILVNLILNESIPTQRMGKNNVMLVCIPTPEMEKPTPLLLRVKTSDEADKLLETINKYKK